MIQCSVKKASVLLVVLCLIVSVMAGVVSADEVTPSNEEYTLSFNGVDSVFFGNATPVNAKAGTEVYITYTVDRIREGHNAPQHGVIGTDQPSLRYPYTEGGVVCYSDDAPILEQGYTYFSCIIWHFSKMYLTHTQKQQYWMGPMIFRSITKLCCLRQSPYLALCF